MHPCSHRRVFWVDPVLVWSADQQSIVWHSLTPQGEEWPLSVEFWCVLLELAEVQGLSLNGWNVKTITQRVYIMQCHVYNKWSKYFHSNQVAIAVTIVYAKKNMHIICFKWSFHVISNIGKEMQTSNICIFYEKLLNLRDYFDW